MAVSDNDMSLKNRVTCDMQINRINRGEISDKDCVYFRALHS